MIFLCTFLINIITTVTACEQEDQQQCCQTLRLTGKGKNIHVIGLGIPGSDTGVTIIPSTTGFAFGGSGSGIELANLNIGTTQAIAGLWWEYIDSCWFHDLVIFGDGINSTYGIYTEGVNNSIIENCRIANQKTAGIHIEGAGNRFLYNSIIRNNMISASSTCASAIKVNGPGVLVGLMLIERNYILGDNFTKTIDVDHAAADIMVADNFEYSAGEGGTRRDNHSS